MNGATDRTHRKLIPPPGEEGSALRDDLLLQPTGESDDVARRAETLKRINLFIRTRWGVLAASLAVLVLGMQTGGLRMAPIPPLLTLLTLAVCNIAFEIDHWWCERAGEHAQMDRVYRSVNLQIDVDLVALSALVYFTGGPYSPFALMYVLHTITAAFLLSRFETFLQSTLALGLFGLVGLVHAVSPDWLNVPAGPWGVPSLAYTATVLAALALTVYGVAWLSTLLVMRTRETTDTLRARANIDGLTGLFNYGYFADQLDVEIERARRFGHPVSLVMVDMDGLKAYNDVNGHLMGSQALKEIAAILKECSRSVDIPAKYGGDEFALILPETAKIGAVVLAERICARVREHPFLLRGNQRLGHLSVSGGVSAFPEDADTIRDLVERTDAALYEAKRSGKDRVSVFGNAGLREASLSRTA